MASPDAPQRPAPKRKTRPPSAGPAKRARSAACPGGGALGLLLQAAALQPSPPGQAQVQAEAGTSTTGACAADGDAGAFQSSGDIESLRHGASVHSGAALAAQEAVRQPAQQGADTSGADSPEVRGAGPQAKQDAQPQTSRVPGFGAGPGPTRAAGPWAQRVVGNGQTRRSPQPGDAEAAGAAAAQPPAAHAPGLHAPGSAQGKPTEAASAPNASGHVPLDGQARLSMHRNRFSSWMSLNIGFESVVQCACEGDSARAKSRWAKHCCMGITLQLSHSKLANCRAH